MNKYRFTFGLAIIAVIILTYITFQKTEAQTKLNKIAVEMNMFDNNPEQVQIALSKNTDCKKNDHNVWIRLNKRQASGKDYNELKEMVISAMRSCEVVK